MEKIVEVVIIVATIGNKSAVIGIAAWLVWALQTVFRNAHWVAAYPFLKSILVRAGVSLVAAGFAIDAFTLYTPGVSEVVMNIGIVVLLFKFRTQYRRNQGGAHHIIEILNRKKSIQ